ncbi:hypothetical protein PoMZ_02536 [Pyricularia oryzae]|uniref:Uncharacterized protein n=1 Tax=Pyricularia oryzae TaxID=318829 RepID=A0A4V1C5U5_PYROR|nr:hypothetical protein PoMZ_02536 [Pyricularia oryzae]
MLPQTFFLFIAGIMAAPLPAGEEDKPKNPQDYGVFIGRPAQLSGKTWEEVFGTKDPEPKTRADPTPYHTMGALYIPNDKQAEVAYQAGVPRKTMQERVPKSHRG